MRIVPLPIFQRTVVNRQMEKIKVTLTAKLKLDPTPEQVDRMLQTLRAYRQACNHVSQTVYETKIAQCYRSTQPALS